MLGTITLHETQESVDSIFIRNEQRNKKSSQQIYNNNRKAKREAARLAKNTTEARRSQRTILSRTIPAEINNEALDIAQYRRTKLPRNRPEQYHWPQHTMEKIKS